MLAEEVDARLRAALDFGLALFGWGEGATVTAFVHLDAVDVDASSGQLSGERHRIGRQYAFE